MEMFRVSPRCCLLVLALTLVVPSGGSHVLADYMTKYIRSTAEDPNTLINFKKSVTSISEVSNGMNVSVRGESTPRTYSHVISTIPLPCLRTIDLSGAGLNVMQKNALRKLQYGPSTKIGIRFKTAWWWTRFGIVGGQSFTDLPIRTIVYPSYGVDSDTPSTVLIASYCWTNDAERLGSLIDTGKEEYDDQLKELVLRNLADVHGMPYDDLVDEFEEMHARDWNRDPLTGGESADINV
jgi:monoamine oxidase